MRTLRYSTQTIEQSDVDAVVESIQSGWLTTGPTVRAFEEALAAYCGARHAVVVANGTAALHVAALAMGLGEGDVAITVPITFLASANCARFVGASVDFCDVRADTVTMDPERLRERLERHPGRVKAVIPVDFGGLPADLAAIYEIAKEAGAFVLEDGCHALGAEYEIDGRWVRVGSCAGSDACVLSFHPVKPITTGEGGAIVTNDDQFAERCRRFRNHGMVHGTSVTLEDPPPWYYEMHEVGFNYRLCDFQCALGLSQLSRVDKFMERRRYIARRYDEAFADCRAIECPYTDECRRSGYHLYYIRLREGHAATDQRGLYHGLVESGIAPQVHYIPVHLQPYYRQHGGFSVGDFPVSEGYYRRTMSIPCYPNMSEQDIDYSIKTILHLVQ